MKSITWWLSVNKKPYILTTKIHPYIRHRLIFDADCISSDWHSVFSSHVTNSYLIQCMQIWFILLGFSSRHITQTSCSAKYQHNWWRLFLIPICSRWTQLWRFRAFHTVITFRTWRVIWIYNYLPRRTTKTWNINNYGRESR